MDVRILSVFITSCHFYRQHCSLTSLPHLSYLLTSPLYFLHLPNHFDPLSFLSLPHPSLSYLLTTYSPPTLLPLLHPSHISIIISLLPLPLSSPSPLSQLIVRYQQWKVSQAAPPFLSLYQKLWWGIYSERTCVLTSLILFFIFYQLFCMCCH